jgi:hypothetical protein
MPLQSRRNNSGDLEALEPIDLYTHILLNSKTLYCTTGKF